MKISRSKIAIGKAGASGSVREAPGGGMTGAPPAIADSVVIAGIPELELTPKVRDALMGLIGEVNELRSEVGRLRMGLADAQARADNDPLLDIPNRRAFVRDLARALAMAERYESTAALIFIDLNDLKAINDAHGHRAGDAALHHLAGVINKNIRAVDSFGRLGGDEFGLILMSATRAVALGKVEQLSALVQAQPLVWKGSEIALTMACGVVEITGNLSAEETLEHADRAMYADKRRVRG